MKKLPATTEKSEIKLKENPKAAAIKKAPDEVIAMAIRDAMTIDRFNVHSKKRVTYIMSFEAEKYLVHVESPEIVPIENKSLKW